MRALGFFPQRSPNLFEKNGYLAGSDEDRASDLNQAFCDDAIRGIFLARGGYGSLRILDRLDPDTLFAHPKPLIGFSDATALAMYLFVHCGLITFSGPMPAGTQIQPMSKEDADHYLRLLTDPEYREPFPGRGTAVRGGYSHGRLIGGNLTMLVHAAAAGFLPPLDGAIVLVEDVNEPPYKIDRALTALRHSGALDEIAGIVAGTFVGVSDETIGNLLDEDFGHLGIPILWMNRRFSIAWKVALSIAVTAYTATLFWLCWLSVRLAYDAITSLTWA